MDLKSGYWQIAVDPVDRPKTAFCSHAGLFEFNVMPFGLVCAPAKFQHLMDTVLAGAKGHCMAYLDDVVIFSRSFDDHCCHLVDVLSRLAVANLRLKLSKCEFLKAEIQYLGHVISARGIYPNPAKVEVIENLDPPAEVRGVRSFLGMSGFYRRFCPSYAEIARPLTHLTKKDVDFYWTNECDLAFQLLKKSLTEAPILAFPDPRMPYKVYTDASHYAIGGVITQEFPEGERAIQYISHQLSKTQRNWPTIEKEAYAIIYCVQKLRQYLLGAKFTIYTDHKPLRSLFTAEMKNARVQRWAIILEEYGCDVQYTTGKSNVQADLLSRIQGEYKMDPIEAEIAVIDSDTQPPHPLSSSLELWEEDEEEYQDDILDILDQPHGMQKLQKNDPYIATLLQACQDENSSAAKEFVTDEEILYHVANPTRHDPTSRLQLVIPKCLVNSILLAFHDQSGHFGIDKTYDKIRRRYFWPSVYKDVVVHLQNCIPCNMKKLKQAKIPFQDMPIATQPFELISIDTCGPFYPETSRGNKYVITIVCHFSGWPEAYPVSNKSAETVARVLLEDFIPRHLCPRYLLSDLGTEYCNQVIDLLCKELNVLRIRTSPYHPASNGRVERFHRVMNESIMKTLASSDKEWDQAISTCLMAYRTSVHESSKHTPYFLTTGHDPVMPMDTLLGPKLKYVGEEYVPTMLQRLHQAYVESRENQVEARERNKRYREKQAEDLNFEVGDAVFYHDPAGQPNSSAKHKEAFQPFYRVIEKVSPVNYVIHHQPTGRVKRTHAEHLRPANAEQAWDTVRSHIRPIGSKYRPQAENPERIQPLRQSKLVNPDALHLVNKASDDQHNENEAGKDLELYPDEPTSMDLDLEEEVQEGGTQPEGEGSGWPQAQTEVSTHPYNLRSRKRDRPLGCDDSPGKRVRVDRKRGGEQMVSAEDKRPRVEAVTLFPWKDLASLIVSNIVEYI